MSVHLSQPAIRLRKDVWSDEVFAEIELAGGVQLNAKQRQNLQVEVERFQAEIEFCELMGGDLGPGDRKWLDSVIKTLDATISALEAPSGVKFRVFYRARLGVGVGIAQLKSLRESCIEERKELGRRGRKLNFRLHELLRDLEFFCAILGGTSTKVSRPTVEPGYRPRESPFISFAWAVFLQMPESIDRTTRRRSLWLGSASSRSEDGDPAETEPAYPGMIVVLCVKALVSLGHPVQPRCAAAQPLRLSIFRRTEEKCSGQKTAGKPSLPTDTTCSNPRRDACV